MRAVFRYFTTPDDPPALRWALLAFLLLIPLYVFAAKAPTAKFNHGGPLEPGGDPTFYKNDQKVYLRTAHQIHNWGSEFISPRQRTTGYSYFLSVFYDHDLWPPPESKEPITLKWFEKAKKINIWLSVFLLAGLGALYARTLSFLNAVAALTASSFLLYVFRAGYTQPELLYWTLNSVLFFLLWQFLRSPGWILGAVSGVLAGVTFFVKAGTLPLIYLFIAAFGFKMIWNWLVLKEGWSWKTMAQGVLVPVLFFLTLLPYFLHSWDTFGSPFYSSYSKYIMWGEDKDEMYAVMTAGAADKKITDGEFQREYRKHYLKRYPDTDPSSIPVRPLPTRKRYFEDNSVATALGRIGDGIDSNKRRMRKYYRDGWKYLQWAFRAALIMAIAAAVVTWRSDRDALRKSILRELPVFLYALGFFTGYLVLYGWYDALGIGARLVLSLYIPALFTLFWVIDRAGRQLKVKLPGGEQLCLGKIISLVFVFYATTKAHKVLTENLYLHYSGA